MKRAALALAALASATVAVAQQTTSPATVEPRTSSVPQEQTTPPADSRARMSATDKLILMGDCMRLVRAHNPNVPEKDLKEYCDKAVKSYSALR